MNYYYIKNVIISLKMLNFLTTLDISRGLFIKAKSRFLLKNI
jgi:hypothetical protein